MGRTGCGRRATSTPAAACSAARRPKRQGRGAKARWPDDYDLGGLRERIERGPHRLRRAAHRGRSPPWCGWRSTCAGSPSRPRPSAAGRSTRVPRSAGAGPPDAAGPDAAGTRAPRSIAATAPPDRRVPGHRPHSDRAGGADRRARPDARRAVGRGRGPPRPPVLRRRSQAVDLPLPPGRHLPVPAGGRSLRWRRRALRLTTNYRSTRSIIAVVNHVFGQLIQPQGHGGVAPAGVRGPRRGARRRAGRPAVASSVAAARRSPPTSPTDAPRRRRPAARLPALRRGRAPAGVGGGRRHDPRAPSTRAGWSTLTRRRPPRLAARAGRRRRHPRAARVAAALEDALTDAGIPYRAESASLVYASRLVRDLLLTLRAIDDPSDELSVVAALRSPAVRLR